MGSVEKRTRTLKNGKVKTFYLARWREPGTDRQPSKSFPKKGLAEDYVIAMEGDKLRGEYIAADAGKVTFKEYADDWLSSQTFDASTHNAVELRLRLHAYPVLGSKSLASLKPSTMQTWLKSLSKLAPSYQQVIFTNVSAVLSAAVADEMIRKNPCKAPSVSPPKATRRRVVPWEPKRVLAVRAELPERYQLVATLAVGLGLRQGEVFGLAVEDVDFQRGRVIVNRQVKLFNGNRQAFALPKFEKVREVPLPASVHDALKNHLQKFPAIAVTLPWKTTDGPPETANLVITSRESKALNRNYFNPFIWKKALEKAGVPVERDNGCHMLRHVYASTLLHDGESIKAVSEYLGHSDPGFTLRTYTHLMPGSDKRTRKAVDSLLRVTSVELPPETEVSAQVSG
ncbi:tyrosine-type recombinase/integrase [Promicromonospora sp. NPDC060204]|uniref:tyrosine-type recombinase/integrase n=1 Tax=Promicromonospora sp. NPDC060204 TaxID=3347071 RepID=UPI00365FD20F